METAICIAKSSGLFSKTDSVHVFGHVRDRTEAHNELNALRKYVCFNILILHFLTYFKEERCFPRNIWRIFKYLPSVL